MNQFLMCMMGSYQIFKENTFCRESILRLIYYGTCIRSSTDLLIITHIFRSTGRLDHSTRDGSVSIKSPGIVLYQTLRENVKSSHVQRNTFCSSDYYSEAYKKYL